jgi:Glycosyl transferase family 2
MIKANETSICSAVMNRTDHLLQALPKWLALPEVGEIIITDWSSDQPIADLIPDAAWEKTKVLQVEGEHRWSLARAFNLAFNQAAGTYVAKMDADFIATPNIFANCNEAGEHFLTGDDQVSRGSAGSFLAPRAYLQKSGLYNELTAGWGAEDKDLYRRLEIVGLEPANFSAGSYSSIPHDGPARVANVKKPIQSNDPVVDRIMALTFKSLRFSSKFNAEICREFDAQTHPFRTSYRITGQDGPVTKLRRNHGAEENLLPFVYRQVARKAAVAYLGETHEGSNDDVELIGLLEGCVRAMILRKSGQE